MKILFVAPWIPSKIRPRSLALLEILAKEHQIRFLGLTSSDEEVRQARELPVESTVLVPRSRVTSMLRCATALPTGTSLQQAYADVPQLSTALASELRQWRPDVVHLNVFRTVHLVERCAPVPVIVDLDEFRSEYYSQLARTAGPKWKLVGRIEAPRMQAREDALVANHVPLMVSAPFEPGEERPNTYVVRSPYDHPEDATPRATEPRVLFVGRLTYEANVDGLLWFLKNCWPEVKKRVPNAVLDIVGTNPPASVQAFRGSGVEIHANVPDVAPYYPRASAAIVPVWRGTGVQMKLIQALAAGVPTVTTPEVARRAGVRHDHEVVVGADAQAWVNELSRVLTDPAGGRRLAAAGRRWAVDFHSSNAVREQLAKAYAAVWPGPDQFRR
ncbi:glycosyltransferase [Micromonospora halophytica]|uniref:Glycosyltransferase involved in cell wall bisynthesis n=1 Tax=Micromonospora halophytica TaxID=47864 RepID=A0A1C5J8P0_9ACTN|nr:glycosyltransferase [Micromonospora halophytica]SCG66940.1 Glycosyltransferase involved in cell wall bisynthesis [Micromonospora halophytica]